MIDGMLIAGFKGFPYEWNYFPIRPITLIFGQNGVGKSSLLQAMAWMNHIQHGGNFNADHLRLTGSHVTLGGYAKFSNRTDILGIACGPFENGQTIGIGWGFRFGDPIPSPGPAEGIRLFYAEDQPMPFQWGLTYEIYGEVGICNVRIYCGPLTFSWDKANLENISDTFSYSGFGAYDIALPYSENPVAAYLIATLGSKGDFDSWTEEWCKEFLEFISAELAKAEFSIVGLAPKLNFRKNPLVKGPKLAKAFLLDFQRAVNQMSQDMVNFLENMQYLGPWRKIPNLQHLPEIEDHCETAEFRLWRHVLENEQIRAGLNSWVKKLGSNIRFEARPNALALCLSPSSEEISPENTGVGISQIVPVIVAALSAESQNWLVEQPELHLHPKAQAILGDLFIQATVSTLGSHHFFLIETHSEHLILRLLRRVRETCQLFSKNDFPMHPNELAVVHVGHIDELGSLRYEEAVAKGENPFPGDGMAEDIEEIENDKRIAVKSTKITSIPVTEQGDFEIKWPGGFFEERLDEMFSDNEIQRWFQGPSQ